MLEPEMKATSEVWRKTGVVSALIAFALLLAEHFIDHGIRLLPVQHHWLSEYVLGESMVGQWLMRIAFFALAGSAVSVAMVLRAAASRVAPAHRTAAAVFVASAIGLAAMAFFDSDPNDGRKYAMQWPPTHGNMHGCMLFLAIGATLLGMCLVTFFLSAGTRRAMVEAAFVGAAISATIAQTCLAIATKDQMTLYGGVTERLIVVAMLGWVLSYLTPPRLAANLGSMLAARDDDRLSFRHPERSPRVTRAAKSKDPG